MLFQMVCSNQIFKTKILNEIVLVFVYLKVTKIVIMEHMHLKKKLAMEAAYWLQFYLPQETAIIYYNGTCPQPALVMKY